jgi:purine-binding chemotaxis protein CheW
LDASIYGIKISQVREIIKPKDMTRMPNMPNYAEGMINMRDHVTTIINLERRLKFSDECEGEKESKRVIVVDYEGVSVGKIGEDLVLIVDLNKILSNCERSSEVLKNKK